MWDYFFAAVRIDPSLFQSYEFKGFKSKFKVYETKYMIFLKIQFSVPTPYYGPQKQ